VHQIISWSNPLPVAEAVARRCNRNFSDVMAEFGSGGYVNTNSEGGGDVDTAVDERQVLLQRLYGGNARRLLEIKKAYDPDNLFHHNSNIGDASSTVDYVTMHD
jgi:hypothetical protein